LKEFHFDDCCDELFSEVLAEALLSNSTLDNLTLSGSSTDVFGIPCLAPLFLALEVNNGLKKLCIEKMGFIDEELSTAMRLGLGGNSTLELLYLMDIKSDENDTLLWREALSFLHTNTALKTLVVDCDGDVTESHATTIRMEIAAALHENESLENISMDYYPAGFKDYLLFVAAIQPNTALKCQSNTTLKSLQLRTHDEELDLDDDEVKDLISVLRKNYGLEEILGLRIGAGDIRSILDLNRAGRRYLVQDGSSISKGVAVLSRVKDDINSVFLHLLENPRLCDRSAVEMASSSTGNMDNAGSTSPENRHNGGKRESQAPSHTGKETRRRLE
jgi:hypothetical protein